MAERMESVGHFEMLWDCEHCGTTALLAKTQRHCAECGAPQNPDKRYFPKEGEEKRLDGHQYEGSDLQCPACSTPQSAKGQNCTQCGAPLDGSKEVRGIATPVTAAPPKPRSWWKLVVILGVIAAIGFGIWYRFIRTREAKMPVTAHRWESSIAIDQFSALQEDGWRDALPKDAMSPNCHRKQRSTKQVATGEEDCRIEKRDKKDGTFEQIKKCTPIYRDEAVEDDWCRYTVQRWKTVDTAKVTGVDLAPVWPTANLPPAQASATLGARRQGKRTQTLILEINKQPCEVSDAVWRKYQDGQQVKVEVRASSGAVVCSSL